MFKSFFKSRKWFLWAYGGSVLLFSLIAFQAFIAWKINAWYKIFYDIIQHPEGHTMEECVALVAYLFIALALPLALANSVTNSFGRLYALRWRESITVWNYAPRWKECRRSIEGAAQRIQEDPQKFTRIIETLGIDVVRTLLQLAIFIPVLWHLSEGVRLPFLPYVPGIFVWSVLVLCIGGTFVSWLVGWKLPGLEYANQRVEAAFRKELVLAEDNRAHYAALVKIAELFSGIKFNYHRLYLHYGYFDLWTSLYYQVMNLAPYMLFIPGVFAGIIALGTFQQALNAFGTVKDGFNILINNWRTIMEFQSIRKRLNEFEETLALDEAAREAFSPAEEDAQPEPELFLEGALHGQHIRCFGASAIIR